MRIAGITIAATMNAPAIRIDTISKRDVWELFSEMMVCDESSINSMGDVPADASILRPTRDAPGPAPRGYFGSDWEDRGEIRAACVVPQKKPTTLKIYISTHSWQVILGHESEHKDPGIRMAELCSAPRNLQSDVSSMIVCCPQVVCMKQRANPMSGLVQGSSLVKPKEPD